MPVSVSLPLALNTVVPLPVGRYAMPPPAIYHAHLYHYQPDCCLHAVHMSVCTTVLTLLQHHAYCLGFSHFAHHWPSSSPSVCHPGCLRYHQSLTRVHSHSLPVPPPLPLAGARSQGGSTVGRSRSLACVTAVRLSCVVPLAGESPLADARLPPHPNGHLLLAKRSPTHHAPLLASTTLYAYMSAFLHPCLLTHLLSVLFTPCLQHFIQSCQHDAASIVHRLRQSPQPQFSIYAHI